MISNSKNQDISSSNWFIIIYEDSVDKNYLEILKSLGVKCAISPIHDKDLLENGEKEKPHRHILLHFNGGRKLNDIEYFIGEINAYKHCEVVRDSQKGYEYLFHKNEPINGRKAHYNEKDIIFINSDIYDYVNRQFRDILNYIDEKDVLSFSRLTKLLRDDDNLKLLKYCSDNCYYIQTYLNSLIHNKEKDIQEKLDYLNSIIKNDGLLSDSHLKRIKALYKD